MRWALNRDDPDDFPTVSAGRLTPRRITALGLAASLVLIAVAGAVALFMVRDTNTTAAQPPSSSPTSMVVASPVPTVTMILPPPVTPIPTPTPTPVSPATNPAAEQSFLAALDGAAGLTGPNHVSYATIPGSHGAYMGDVSAWTIGD